MRNHQAKAEEPRNGVAAPSTVFPGRLTLRFPCISMLEKLLSRTVLQEPQGRGVHTANLDCDQTSRLLETG